MDEIIETTAESTELDGFDEGWDENLGETTEETGGENQPAEAAEETGSETADKEPEKAEENTPPAEGAEGSFELNYMGQTERVGKNEVLALAQKGKDYDRIRAERDELKPLAAELEAGKAKLAKYEEFLNMLAGGKDIDTMMDDTRAQIMVRDGKAADKDAALERIRFEREKAAFEAEKAKKSEPKAEESKEKAAPETGDTKIANAKRQDELIAFAREFPNVKAEEIPNEVWADFHRGIPLSYAYAKNQNNKLKAEMEALKQEKSNRERSTGSTQTAGAGSKRDAFDEGWDYE